MNRHDVTHNLATAFMNRYDELPQRWHYVNTLGLECFYRVARTLDDKAWLAWVKERYDRFFNSEGIIEEYVLNEFSVDLISAGKLLFDLCGSYGEERYLDQIKAIAHQFTLQMRTPSGGFWHKAIYPQQMWLDGLYMHGPFIFATAFLRTPSLPCLTISFSNSSSCTRKRTIPLPAFSTTHGMSTGR